MNTAVGILGLACLFTLAALAYVGAVLLSHREQRTRASSEHAQARLTLSLHPAYQARVAADRAYALARARLAVETYVALHYVPAEKYIVNAQVETLTALPSLKAPKYAPSSESSDSPAVCMPIMTLTQQLRGEQTRPHEPESILGYDAQGPRRGPWNKLHSFFVVGGSGSGKSSTVAYYAALGVLHGARLLIIDPDSEFSESITNRLAALSPFLLCPVGTDLRSASRVIEVASRESEAGGPYPVVFIVDEFSTIMRHGQTGGEWKDIAGPLASVLEEYGQRGRKRKRTCILIGQIAKATRTGGTELRESMTATFVHRIKPQQARLVLDSDEAEHCQYLVPGEAMILLSNAVETYRMRIPYADQEAMQLVADMMHKSVSAEEAHEIRPKGPEIDLETAWQAKVRRVRQLWQESATKGEPLTQKQVLYLVWGVTPGGSEAYTRARSEYRTILDVLNAQQEEER